MHMKVFSSITAATAVPHLIRLDRNLYGLFFKIMKLVPAMFIIERAMERGELRPGGHVAETSSGTFALGLGLACRERGIPFRIFTDPVIGRGLQSQLRLLGGEVVVAQRPAANGGYQRARLDRLHEHLARNPLAYWPNQYGNPDHPRAYAPIADELLERIESKLALVGSVGSGGSTCGMVAQLRKARPDTPLIAVDTFGSVIFGQRDRPRQLRGLGNSILPENVRHEFFDDVHWVSADVAFNATRALLRERAVFAGPTTGAAYLVARWYAEEHPERTVIFIGPDEGHRYLPTVYNDAWLTEQSFVPDAPLPIRPAIVDTPDCAHDKWSAYHWKRRSAHRVDEVANVSA